MCSQIFAQKQVVEKELKKKKKRYSAFLHLEKVHEKVIRKGV